MAQTLTHTEPVVTLHGRAADIVVALAATEEKAGHSAFKRTSDSISFEDVVPWEYGAIDGTRISGTTKETTTIKFASRGNRTDVLVEIQADVSDVPDRALRMISLGFYDMAIDKGQSVKERVAGAARQPVAPAERSL